MTTLVCAGSVEAHKAAQAGRYVYIGRPSKWGNPWTIAQMGSREAAVAAFRTWWFSPINAPMRAAALVELKDKVLGCYCKPRACHGDVIVAYVNSYAGPESSLR